MSAIPGIYFFKYVSVFVLEYCYCYGVPLGYFLRNTLPVTGWRFGGAGWSGAVSDMWLA